MAKNKGLGRGLDAIFFDNSVEESPKNGGTVTVRMSEIDINPSQPRKEFDGAALSQLADSISANGLLQPILVREKEGRYEIIAGERRFRASKLAGLSEVPVIVTEADDAKAAQLALIENLQREDLNPHEEAAAYASLMSEYGMTQEEIAGSIGKSRSAIANSVRLLDLPEEVLTYLRQGLLSAGHCRALLGLNDREQIAPMAERAMKGEWNVRDVEAEVRRANRDSAAEEEEQESEPIVNYYRAAEERFLAATGSRLRIKEKGKKKTISLEFGDDSELEEILKKLAGEHLFDD